MMRVANDFDVKCDCCGCVIRFFADEFEYETHAYERNMGDEIEYDFSCDRECECGNSIVVRVYGYEYPVGAFNYTSYEFERGTPLQEPSAEMDYADYEFDLEYEAYVAKECDALSAAIEQRKSEIQAMSPRQFELFVTDLFEKKGYSAKTTKQTRDDGFDIVATSSYPFPFTIIVECKHWSNVVGVKVVRELFGVNAARNANKLILVTSSSFSPEARALAGTQQDMMTLWDLEDLIRLAEPKRKGDTFR